LLAPDTLALCPCSQHLFFHLVGSWNPLPFPCFMFSFHFPPNEDIINLFGFTLQDNIFELGRSFFAWSFYLYFVELEQVFCKCYKTDKNDEHIYTKLKNIKP
jgi:hypothetical protein